MFVEGRSMEGSLSKWTNLMKGWQNRWFVLDDSAGLLSYYLSRSRMIRGDRRGCISLKRAVVSIENEDDTTFTVTSQLKTYHFQARDPLERDIWLRCLEDTILRHAYGSRRRKTIEVEGFTKQPNIRDFEKKLCEADAYLQLVIDQTQLINDKMETLLEFEDQARCSMITTYANNMLDEAKHTIVLLQIAKHTMNDDVKTEPPVQPAEEHDTASADEPLTVALPEHTSKAAHSTSEDDFFDAVELDVICNVTEYDRNSRSDKSNETSTRNSNITEKTEFVSSTTSVERGAADYRKNSSTDDIENRGKRGSISPVHGLSVISSIESDLTPDDSEVSNETDDDEFGLHEITEEEAVASRRIETEDTQNIEMKVVKNEALSGRKQEFVRDDGSLNYDYFYDCKEESEVKVECSVVSHLLSQVKIGMDLSKVVLPTFILEKRSLLEMYADFFAHPDLFLGITDQPDAKQRMVQVVKWYITAFHAGRKTSVPKKPYNPVLGEIFRCFWDVSGVSSETEILEGGPVPWCTIDKLAFAAEQVSHHPPVSAFYAECPIKKISCCAFVWTKSKFLGLSIGVTNEGKALVNLLEHDEQYTLTFPSAYGRSIFTKPWFELGGTVHMSCEKTGYSAKIDFLTKPFYGNKKHRIFGEIFDAHGKKPFLTIDGEWCGIVKAKTSGGEEVEFADVKNMKVSKKTVKPVNEQESYESRRVWKEVTAGLWLDDISRATNAKIEVESRQRQEEQARRGNGIEWKTRLFETEATGNWIYRAPLENRIAAIKKISPHLQ